ncbi:hypothetical protein Pan216_18480 [Planctomycetes bacterium Pan216]|uniref:Uncharacterized protein n=1 Tax=Kolteria novifilia TaxID=2527975 RepID=A0A518B1Z2_9BACT|nr:hypothetical protein Pan216_18480 [Planctomycetes bacterium Pan216]
MDGSEDAEYRCPTVHRTFAGREFDNSAELIPSRVGWDAAEGELRPVLAGASTFVSLGTEFVRKITSAFRGSLGEMGEGMRGR